MYNHTKNPYKKRDFLVLIYNIMKKFSNISNNPVKEEPKVEITKEEVEINEFKNQIMSLMNDILSVQSYGSARQEILMTTKIVGKEMFVEALTDLLSKKSDDKVVETLESLKSTNTDWVSIDEKINDIKINTIDINQKSSIDNIINKYSEEDVKFYVANIYKNENIQDLKEKLRNSELLYKETNSNVYKIFSEGIKSKINNLI